MKKPYVLLLALIIYSGQLLAQDSTRLITGTVSHKGEPISDVRIVLKDQELGTSTDLKGKYGIKADAGQYLVFSYVGLQTMTIKIEDVTDILNIKMYDSRNQLDETIVTTKKKEKTSVLKRWEKKNRKFKTARGSIDPKKSGFAIGYIDGDDLLSGEYLSDILRARVPGYYKGYLRNNHTTSFIQDYPAIYEVDGILTNQPIDMISDINTITDIYVLRSIASTVMYGALGRGGVIVIKTKNNPNNRPNYGASNEDAVDLSTPYDGDAILANLSLDSNDPVKNIETNNPEELKVQAYIATQEGNYEEAVALYQTISSLRPSYIQSYRDLANAYVDNAEYDKAWRVYLSSMFNHNLTKDEGIGEIIYNEMEWLYYNHHDASKIYHKFIPSQESIKDFQRDVRLVFEWNTSEAEFDLEFVNPKNQAYNYEHSSKGEQNIIEIEKEKGYSSKEFSIYDIDEFNYGNWLVNLTYLGNKKPEPTFFKVTTYYNWGRSNQTEEVSIFKLDQRGVKFNLFNYNNTAVME